MIAPLVDDHYLFEGFIFEKKFDSSLSRYELTICHISQQTNSYAQIAYCKEYVASLIGLYKNSGAVLCVGIYFLFI